MRKTANKTTKEFDWRTCRMRHDYSTMEDVIDSMHYAPGTKLKLHYLIRIGNTPYIETTRTVTVVKEYKTWLLVDFEKYLGTIDKADVLVDGQIITLH